MHKSVEYRPNAKNTGPRPTALGEVAEKLTCASSKISGPYVQGQLGMSVDWSCWCITALDRAEQVARHWAAAGCPVVDPLDKSVP